MPENKKKLFKDWFDQDAAQRLSSQIKDVYPEFDQNHFIANAVKNLKKLEMNARVTQFAQAMSDTLPGDKKRALEILTLSLPDLKSGNEPISDGWLQWPVGAFIAAYGLPHYETSIQAMIELTQRFSSEFAVRPFLEAEPEKTLNRLLKLTSHPSEHVRRWCSEGSRPLLPWGKRIPSLVHDPSPLWPILEALKDDPSPYVRKSVANHLNDISKHHPEQVIACCTRWQQNASAERRWIIRHGLRTLIKNGHPDALALMGFAPADNIRSQLCLSPSAIQIGENVLISLQLENCAPKKQPLLIDYAVIYVRQKGKTGRKVFKWTQKEFSPGEKLTLQKNHPMQITSVRALYPGTHEVEVMVNGKTVASAEFELKNRR